MFVKQQYWQEKETLIAFNFIFDSLLYCFKKEMLT